MVCEAESTRAAKTSTVRGSSPLWQWPALRGASRNLLLSALADGTASMRAPHHLHPFPSSSVRDCVHIRRTAHPRPSSWWCLCGVGPDGYTHVWICAECSTHTAFP